jgi:hypothetical protein
MAVTPTARPVTGTGVSSVFAVPFPSSPSLLSPQAKTPPFFKAKL